MIVRTVLIYRRLRPALGWRRRCLSVTQCQFQQLCVNTGRDRIYQAP